MNIGKQELETLEEIDPHWRATQWLQVAVQGIMEEEVPWYELVTLLTSGVKGAALYLAKHLVTAWCTVRMTALLLCLSSIYYG